MEKLLRNLLLVPRRIYDAILRFNRNFKQGGWAIKLKVIAFLILGFIILVPLAALGIFIVLSLIILNFILSLFASQRKGPPNLY